MAISAHHPQVNGKKEAIKCTIGHILYVYLPNEAPEHWPDYMAVTKVAINSTFNATIKKSPFEII